jgi:hypothetical protein
MASYTTHSWWVEIFCRILMLKYVYLGEAAEQAYLESFPDGPCRTLCETHTQGGRTVYLEDKQMKQVKVQ